MKKKLILMLSMLALLICVLAISVSAARTENYNDTFTLQSSGQIVHYQKWFYNDGNSMVRKGYTDTITISFFDEEGNPLTEVAMWEYDEKEGRYYSLVWFISDYELFWDDQIYSDANVGEQTYPKYTRANYTLTSVRALDLRYLTYNDKKSHSAVESWKEGRTLKALKGIYYDTNNTPNDTKDDIKLQDSVGIGRDQDNYGYFGYDAQFEATGNKIVVGNFRDCDFQCDREGNYGTSNTWSRADNLQCLWYPDTMLYIYAGIGNVYEVDLGDNMEIIACQVLRDNKRVKSFKIPNSVLYLNNEAFRGTDLTDLIIGESLQVHGTSPFLYTGAADNYYLSKNLLTDAYTGKVNQLLAGNNTTITIYFDGDAEDAAALVNKLIAEDTKYKDKVVLFDYNEVTDKGDLKNAVALFYNYNRCEAFYDGQHVGAEELLLDEKLGYLGDITVAIVCTKCGDKTVIDNYGTIFTYYGYSYTEAPINGTYSMSQFYGFNESVLAKYTAKTGAEFEFGLVVSSVDNPLSSELLGTNKVLVATQGQINHNYFDVKLYGITEGHIDSEIVFCAFVKDGGKIFYLDNGITSETIEGKSFNQIKQLENAKAE